ncbi:hypothetical protein KHS38_07325 [Mucilaginibacter sp. Bleaf8]|uniref:hypothetical protein n=1 Tax=Mucilaginibacter sp. Bleaf8 TaxID=2834430 RepID=UPI001BD12832|nr:hypothetical protein [Mucilaginibacter sp. Bleaf8]MBS7564213.1 hypothetical protein [Mucilaginibacter sp. Bleaf8]
MHTQQIVNEKITVDEAIRKGRKMLLLPRILLLAGIAFFTQLGLIYYMICKNAQSSAGRVLQVQFGVGVALGFFLLVYLPFLFWSKKTTQWKLWAFENVRNVHELMHVAKRAALCYSPGTFLDRLQIQSKSERERWAALQGKFDVEDIFIDAPEVPPQTVIYLSSSYQIFNIIFNLLCVGVGSFLIYLGFQSLKTSWLALVGAAIAIATLKSAITLTKSLIARQPQITLNVKGIQIQQAELHSWADIKEEQVQSESRHKATVWVLKYNYLNEHQKLDINDLAISVTGMEKLLRVYRGRHSAMSNKS